LSLEVFIVDKITIELYDSDRQTSYFWRDMNEITLIMTWYLRTILKTCRRDMKFGKRLQRVGREW